MNKKFSRFLHYVFLMLAVLLVLLLGFRVPMAAQEPDAPPFDFVDDVVDSVDVVSEQQRILRTSLITQTDPDGDGLTTTEETQLGTDPNNVDSDCDFIDDKTEVGNVASPTNSDGDTLIDALESKLVDSDGDSTDDQADSDTTAPQLSCGQFTPFAVKDDNSETTRLEVRVAGGTQVTAVALVPSNLSTNWIKQNGVFLSTSTDIPLFDDGTNGDRIANDGVWSRDNFTGDSSQATVPAGFRLVVEFDAVRVTDNGSFKPINRNTVFNISAPMTLGIVRAADVTDTPVAVKSTLQTMSHLANIIDPLGSLAVKNSDFVSMSKRFYQDFPDDYDFIAFFADTWVPNSVFGRFSAIKNDAENIGVPTYDSTAAYGSNGKLRGPMFLNFGTNGPTIHEMIHSWAVKGSDWSTLGFTQCTGASHWGVAGLGEGQLGGFDPATLVDNLDGTYTVDSFGTVANGGDGALIAPLERYLMGLSDAASVPEIKIPVNVDCNSFTSANGKTTFAAQSINTVTIEQIQTALGGPRNPAATNAQKDFRMAMSIISQYKLNATEMTFFNEWAMILGNDLDSTLNSFSEASGGTATLNTRLSVSSNPSTVYLPMVIKN